MSISPIPQKEFAAFGQTSRTDARTTEEMEWFADARWFVLGVISRDKSDQRLLSIAALGRDEYGLFHAFDAVTGFTTVDDARRVLFAKMELASSTGARTFPAKRA